MKSSIQTLRRVMEAKNYARTFVFHRVKSCREKRPPSTTKFSSFHGFTYRGGSKGCLSLFFVLLYSFLSLFQTRSDTIFRRSSHIITLHFHAQWLKVGHKVPFYFFNNVFQVTSSLFSSTKQDWKCFSDIWPRFKTFLLIWKMPFSHRKHNILSKIVNNTDYWVITTTMLRATSRSNRKLKANIATKLLVGPR